eukprot:CAMPEP_0168779336 /NCGR_PEP_ID=MMETSP0725-20121227/7550_1 /TAXON_ID=265536 /ORGANISM="Amphiprora sp., Strain CCMP467" /LENGTH=769 /DNA_ID=CAMNT_0008829143 /DNA_START=92 /DNA_END=2401 /DNA_ORIENTATION=-
MTNPPLRFMIVTMILGLVAASSSSSSSHVRLNGRVEVPGLLVLSNSNQMEASQATAYQRRRRLQNMNQNTNQMMMMMMAPTSFPTSSPTRTPRGSPAQMNQRNMRMMMMMTPTSFPTSSPTSNPTSSNPPTASAHPSVSPSDSPSVLPSATPTLSNQPSLLPSQGPTKSVSPSTAPSSLPSLSPSASPSDRPSFVPSATPTLSQEPSIMPSQGPTKSVSPSDAPSSQPSSSPSVSPSDRPSLAPSVTPTLSHEPSIMPSQGPTKSASPSDAPSSQPSSSPSSSPSGSPSLAPSKSPSLNPTGRPSVVPSDLPTVSNPPSQVPSLSPTISMVPTSMPSGLPTESMSPSMHKHGVTIIQDDGVLTECQTVQIPESSLDSVTDQDFGYSFRICLSNPGALSSDLTGRVQSDLSTDLIDTFLTCDYGNSESGLEVANIFFPIEFPSCVADNGASTVTNCFACESSFRMKVFTSSGDGDGRKLQIATTLSDGLLKQVISSFLVSFFNQAVIPRTTLLEWAGFTNEEEEQTVDEKNGETANTENDNEDAAVEGLQSNDLVSGDALGSSSSSSFAAVGVASVIGASVFFIVFGAVAARNRLKRQLPHSTLEDGSHSEEDHSDENEPHQLDSDSAVINNLSIIYSDGNDTFFSSNRALRVLGVDTEGLNGYPTDESQHIDQEVSTTMSGDADSSNVYQPASGLCANLGDLLGGDEEHDSALRSPLSDADAELMFEERSALDEQTYTNNLKGAMRDLEPSLPNHPDSRGYQLDDTIDL